jgi:hypothetical protein
MSGLATNFAVEIGTVDCFPPKKMNTRILLASRKKMHDKVSSIGIARSCDRNDFRYREEGSILSRGRGRASRSGGGVIWRELLSLGGV